MKYIFSTFLSLLTLTAFAQDCNKESLRQKPGTWKAGPQGSIHDVAAADLAKEKAVLAGIHKMITAKYAPTGCQIDFSTVYGKYAADGQTWVADPYHYTMSILRFLCDRNSADKSKYYVDISTTTTVNITANVVFSLNNLYAATVAPDEARSYLKLKQKPEKKDGVWYMGEEVVGDYGTPGEIKEYRWLITYNDTLPFYYLSRKEYLLIQKKRLEKSIKEVPSEKEYAEQYLRNVNEYLKKPDAELALPAICMWNEEERFEKFVEEGTRGSFFAVKPNLDYYHKKLPKSSPQFFTVVYKIAKGDAVFADNYEAIKKAVDFATLKNMLGK
ncbi:hypothetical protein [Flavihumibacter petaseus]|nr:hypothetical protein [Flavihumibacter petaseus]